MTLRLAIAGGGIGGLAAALACRREGCEVRVFEQADSFSEVGAGIQLGPNATRVLAAWELDPALRRAACEPDALVVRDAGDGRELGRLTLGPSFARRYGAPYLTIRRADLQRVLLDAARATGARLEPGTRVRFDEPVPGDALVAADGIWSELRANVVHDGPARSTGHVAYRGLVPQSSLPGHLRRQTIALWLGQRTHVVAYPVRAGEQLNVVAIVDAGREAVSRDWERSGQGADLLRAIGSVEPALRALIEGVPSWGLWSLHERAPLAGPHAMARARVALLGDAAHPMLPYLAQGAGMAIEDADALARALAGASPADVPAAFARYAQARWRRCAQVQARARRNAAIFHAEGVVRWGRDVAMRALGERLLDQPWLYGFSALGPGAPRAAA